MPTPSIRDLERLLCQIRYANMAAAHHDQWEHGGSSSASTEQRAAMDAELAQASRSREQATTALTALVAQLRATAPDVVAAWADAHVAYLSAFLDECVARGAFYEVMASYAVRERDQWAEVASGTRVFVEEVYLDTSLVPAHYRRLFGLDPRTFEDVEPQ